MLTLLEDSAGARARDRAARAAAADLVAEIAQTLLMLGGSAHRDTVIDRIAIRRGQMAASDDLRAEVLEAFERHRASHARNRGKPALLDLPFGEGSRRWSLTHYAAALAAHVENEAAAVGRVAAEPRVVAHPLQAAAAPAADALETRAA